MHVTEVTEDHTFTLSLIAPSDGSEDITVQSRRWTNTGKYETYPVVFRPDMLRLIVKDGSTIRRAYVSGRILRKDGNPGQRRTSQGYPTGADLGLPTWAADQLRRLNLSWLAKIDIPA